MKLGKLLLLLFIFSSCSTGLSVYDLKPGTKKIMAFESFRVFSDKDEIDMSEFQNLGRFEFKDAGLTLDCNYSTVVNMATEKARSIGANGIKISEHKVPDAYSTCHRLKGTFLFSENMWTYENEIIWYPERQLELRDFRGENTNSQLITTTMSGFKFEYISNPIKGNVQVEAKTFFQPFESFITNKEDTSLLKIQQLHFDASELYSRKFINNLLSECKNLGQLEAYFQSIYNEHQNGLRILQNEISNKAYRNTEERERLMQLVKEGLVEYSAFSKDSYFISIN